MDYNDLLDLLKKRRSIRKFKPDPVPDEYVDKIIEAARWAPSGANSQPWQFIVIKKKDLREKIFELHNQGQVEVRKMEALRDDEELRFNFGPRSFDVAPVFILVCGDTRLKDCFPFIGAMSDHGGKILESSLASTFLYMMLAATTLGLGAHWVTAVNSPVLQILMKRLLGIPKELLIYDMMVLGYPDMIPPPRMVRDKKDIVHYDGYDKSKLATDKQIRDFIIKIRKSGGM